MTNAHDRCRCSTTTQWVLLRMRMLLLLLMLRMRQLPLLLQIQLQPRLHQRPSLRENEERQRRGRAVGFAQTQRDSLWMTTRRTKLLAVSSWSRASVSCSLLHATQQRTDAKLSATQRLHRPLLLREVK